MQISRELKNSKKAPEEVLNVAEAPIQTENKARTPSSHASTSKAQSKFDETNETTKQSGKFQSHSKKLSPCPCLIVGHRTTDEMRRCVLTKCINRVLSPCKPDQLYGRRSADDQIITMATLEQQYSDDIALFNNIGGWWYPDEKCAPKHHVAIIIPFRERETHLPILLKNLIPILRKRRYHYRIFVIEQSKKYTFNKGKLQNIGFKEALKHFPYTCFIFHDVDLIPEDDRIYYGCEDSPMHLSVAIDIYEYKLPYSFLFGGVQMFTRAHYELINGYSNSFWYWGGEDDNLYMRTKHRNIKPKRQDTEVARYKSLFHKRRDLMQNGMKFMEKSLQYFEKDGLNNLQYSVESIRELPLYTHIVVDVNKEGDREFGLFTYEKDDFLTLHRMGKL